jgi:glycosyltransferase involved in cell wall biosynthesis
MKKVTIITPTTGSKYLSKCLSSVDKQTYENLNHFVVIDGPKFRVTASNILQYYSLDKRTVITLPENTGAGGYNGHRIYGSIPYILNTDYVMFLDEDNWLEPNHIESLVNVIEQGNDWAFSLRNIYDSNSNFICTDDCENLGLWPTCISEQELFVDVGAYFLPTPIAIQISPLWYRRARHPDEQPEVDRIIMQVLLQYGFKYNTNGEYTLNYRVGNRTDSVQKDFFVWGNEKMKQKYNGEYPWRKK